jgi:D-alanyl-D-alanine carboxypeptidase
MIKVLTAIVVLNYVADLDMQATITEEDRSSATPISSAYNLFQGGEKLTIRDLLYASLLQSSNIANYVLARVVGQFLLETYGSKGFIPEDNPGE